MQGLSFREYINLTLKKDFPAVTLDEIIYQHRSMAPQIIQEIRPLQYFAAYLKSGYYPFFLEHLELYYSRIEEVINFILEVELPQLRKMEIAYVNKIKQLLQIIASSVPFIPNVSKLSQKIQIDRNTLVTYLNYLNETNITKNLYQSGQGISRLQKPDKLYLENTNLVYVFAQENNNIGNIRETFFLNQVGYQHNIHYTSPGDFLVDDKFTFELGGQSKSTQQIEGISNAYVASDNIEIGTDQKIPLWLFGFLY